MSLWMTCQGHEHCQSLDLEPWRMVEAQHISSSRDLVESREEHDLLEALLEKSKPPVDIYKHYLIFTPFRYPPLAYGSRFGHTMAPSLWYGSLELDTVLAEVAFYRLKFFEDSAAPLAYIELPMTAFKAYIQTEHGVDLTDEPFKAYQHLISHPDHYEYSQPLGADMRAAKVDAFIYRSARDKKSGKNLAVFTPDVFKMKNGQYITHIQTWRCIANKQVIEFTRDGVTGREKRFFERGQWA